MRAKKFLGVIALTLFLAVQAFAGIVVKVQGWNVSKEQWEEISYFWDDGNIKFNSPDPSQGSFMLKDGEFLMVQLQKGRYLNATSQIKDRFTDEQDAVAETMKSLGQIFEGIVSKYTITATKNKMNVAGFTCTEYKTTDETKVKMYFSKDPKLLKIMQKAKDAVKGKKGKTDFLFLHEDAGKGVLLWVDTENKGDIIKVLSVEEKDDLSSEFSLEGLTEVSSYSELFADDTEEQEYSPYEEQEDQEGQDEDLR